MTGVRAGVRTELRTSHNVSHASFQMTGILNTALPRKFTASATTSTSLLLQFTWKQSQDYLFHTAERGSGLRNGFNLACTPWDSTFWKGLAYFPHRISIFLTPSASLFDTNFRKRQVLIDWKINAFLIH